MKDQDNRYEQYKPLLECLEQYQQNTKDKIQDELLHLEEWEKIT